MSRVVVGFDNSPHAVNALRVAADQARWRNLPLDVVHVYTPVRTREGAVASVVASGTWTPQESNLQTLHDARGHDAADRSTARTHAVELTRRLIADADEVDLDGVQVEVTAVSDEHPASALIRLSRGADVLVVGARGRGGFRGLLLGSISQQCVRHAACDVLVTRLPDDD